MENKSFIIGSVFLDAIDIIEARISDTIPIGSDLGKPLQRASPTIQIAYSQLSE